MSQIMEKTLASLPKLLTQSFIGGRTTKSSNRRTPSQEVQVFMKFVHRARSKSHEATIVNAELANIQQKLKQSDPNGSLGIVRSCFTKIIFCHILGYDVSFAAIYAVNLAQQGQGYEKRLGYLLSCLLLHTQHDMVMLMMATLIRDLKSSNMANNCIALLVASELVGSETIPSILPEVIKKLGHSHELVREKALHCLRSFYQCAPSLLQPYLSQLNVFLSSRDPGVLTAVTNFFLILCHDNPARYVALGSSFLHILDQINHRGFGTNYYYHMVPLPWLQVSLLKILGSLGAADAQLSKAIAPLLQTLIEKTKVTEPISLAVLVESVLTATQINANEELLNLCSRCIGKLLSPDASNAMKYQGLGLLISLSRVKSLFAAQHQMAVVECLMDEDAAIQARTTHLLHAMANRANVKAVCTRLFEQINKTSDKLFISDTIQMISDLTERLAVDIDWYLDTYLNILELKLTSQMRDNFISLVLSRMEKVSITEESISSDSLPKLTSTLLNVLSKHDSGHANVLLSLQLLGVLAPVIGDTLFETSFLLLAEKLLSRELTNSKQRKIAMLKPPEQLCRVNDGYQSEDVTLQSCCLVTISKLVLGGCLQVDSVKNWLQNHDYRQLLRNLTVNCYLNELEELLQHPEDLLLRSKIMFHTQNTEIDLSLSFLDKLVVQNLLQGGGLLKPKYVKLTEQVDNPSITSLTLAGPGDHSGSEPNIPQTLAAEGHTILSSFSSKMSGSLVKSKTKWRDNDEECEEHFEDVGAVDEEDESKKRYEEIAQELFAGLDEINSSEPHWTPQNKSNTKKLQNIWYDDNDDDKEGHGWSSLDIHPFGIYRKAQSNTNWKDEDVENDNLSFGMDDNKSDLGFISCQSEKAESPSSPNYKSADSDIFGKLGDGQVTELLTHSLCKSYPGTYTEPNIQGRVPTASIYSDSSADLGSVEKLSSGLASSEQMSISTIDALTDSDPEEKDS